MKAKELAEIYGVTIHTVRKWPLAKRQQLITEAQQGINPHIAEAIAKLSVTCYKAQARTGKGVKFDLWQANCAFEVFLFEPGMKILVERSDLNCINLAGALAIVEAL
jgi:hypothetical protein